KWKQEIATNGNPPCPRSEMGVSYNAVLDKTIIYGGYSPNLMSCRSLIASPLLINQPTSYPERKDFLSFTYFGDTFMLEPALNSAGPT
ncbi:hypothetical protein C8J56DRAFT_962521, partial [Mycena floridula]